MSAYCDMSPVLERTIVDHTEGRDAQANRPPWQGLCQRDEQAVRELLRQLECYEVETCPPAARPAPSDSSR